MCHNERDRREKSGVETVEELFGQQVARTRRHGDTRPLTPRQYTRIIEDAPRRTKRKRGER